MQTSEEILNEYKKFEVQDEIDNHEMMGELCIQEGVQQIDSCYELTEIVSVLKGDIDVINIKENADGSRDIRIVTKKEKIYDY